MQQALAFIRLIRFPNLLIISLTQYLVKIFLDFTTYPEINLPDFNFFLLSLSTVMIAAAGYIINDYFDIKADLINKPEEVIVGNTITRRAAMSSHIVLNVTAVMLGSYVFWRAGNINLVSIYIIAAGLLWYYTTTFKKQLIIGNIIISFLAAMTVLIVGIYEKQLATKIILAYAYFAFIITLIREIIKDMEDMGGDSEMGCHTLPLVYGAKKTKMIVAIINTFTIVSLAYFQYYLFQNNAWVHILYLSCFTQIPLFILYWFLYHAETPRHYHRISNLLKLIMITGILTLIIFYYL